MLIFRLQTGACLYSCFLADNWSVPISDEGVTQLVTDTEQHMIYLFVALALLTHVLLFENILLKINCF